MIYLDVITWWSPDHTQPMCMQYCLPFQQHLCAPLSPSLLYKHSIASLKRMKNEVQQVGKGTECGVLFDDFTGFQPGDVLECIGTEAISASSKDILETAPGQHKG